MHSAIFPMRFVLKAWQKYRYYTHHSGGSYLPDAILTDNDFYWTARYSTKLFNHHQSNYIWLKEGCSFTARLVLAKQCLHLVFSGGDTGAGYVLHNSCGSMRKQLSGGWEAQVQSDLQSQKSAFSKMTLPRDMSSSYYILALLAR